MILRGYSVEMLVAVLIAGIFHSASGGTMDVVHSWKYMDFEFPSIEARAAMIRTGKFIPANVAPIDVDVWEGPTGQTQKLFVTTPRLKPGVPATLSTVGLSGLLSPYPEWSVHREGDCSHIVSVFRVDIDQCGRLWVVDTGVINNFEANSSMICPPKIMAYNLYNDRLAGAPYEFPPELISPGSSLLGTLAVDARGATCEDTHIYIADITGYKLIVYNPEKGTSWKVNNNYFYPYPLHGSFHINGVDFELMDGVIGLALGPITGGDRRLYFHSLASVRESWVPTSVLQNETLFTEGDGSPRSFKVSQYTRNSPSAAQAMSSSGVLFFGLLNSNAIACWNSRLSYTTDNIITIAKDDTRLQFPSGIKLRNGFLWTVSNKFQNYIDGRINFRQINYRILAGSLAILTHDTSCHYPEDSHFFKSTYNPFDRIIFY